MWRSVLGTACDQIQAGFIRISAQWDGVTIDSCFKIHPSVFADECAC